MWSVLHRTHREHENTRVANTPLSAIVLDNKLLIYAQIDLLTEAQSAVYSDFYSYRYFASEGFLPGYNFPRLPVRALVTVRNSARSIDRFRFLGLSEFGPQNVIYHEGRRHRVSAAVLPTSDIGDLLRRARLCNTCGYIHTDQAVTLDKCQNCGTRMDQATSDFPQKLLMQPTVRTRQQERISSDEETRLRSGYKITTHFRFAPSVEHRVAQVTDTDGAALLEARYAPAADIWRINHGWRVGDHNGFSIEPQTGRWARRDGGTGPTDAEPDLLAPVDGVKPYVFDSRNLLLLRPLGETPTPEFMTTLLYAIRRGIQFVYQVEEQEVAAELIGEGEHARLMLWEAAEGGTGVWERLVEDSTAFAEVARHALRLCHFDPVTGEEEPDLEPDRCAVACYDCLLSYSNQQQHRYLDRHVLRDFLVRMADATTAPVVEGRTRDEQHEWLRARVDPASSLEPHFLEFLYSSGYRLPDAAQNRPSDEVYAQPDFYYEREGVPGACVFVDGGAHDAPLRANRDAKVRAALEDKGYRVIAIKGDEPFEGQVAAHADIFGEGPGGQST